MTQLLLHQAAHLKKKYLYILAYMFLFLGSYSYAQKNYEIIRSSDSASYQGILFFEFGVIREGKFTYSDIRSETALVFYKQRRNNTFKVDTSYALIGKGDVIFRRILDSLNVKYNTYETNRTYMFSLANQLKKDHAVKIKTCAKKGRKSVSLVFIKLNVSIKYNQSYIRSDPNEEKYEFKGKRLCYHPNKKIISKPILEFEITE